MNQVNDFSNSLYCKELRGGNVKYSWLTNVGESPYRETPQKGTFQQQFQLAIRLALQLMIKILRSTLQRLLKFLLAKNGVCGTRVRVKRHENL